MKHLAMTAMALALIGGQVRAAEPTDLVRPLAGTSNSRWMVFPGPTLPMGMVKLSPDNQGQMWNGGYEYTVASISGFSLLHNMAMRSFAIMPSTGPLNLDPSSSRFQPGAPEGPFGGMWTAGWRSRIDKATEVAETGYYGVQLMDSGVKAELTSTERTGLLRFTFPQTDQAHIFLDFDPPAEEQIQTTALHLTQVSPTRFEGEMAQTGNYASNFTVYFVIETDTPADDVLTWVNQPYQGTDTNYGTAWRRHADIQPMNGSFDAKGGAGAVLNFKTQAGQKVQVRSGISFVSLDNARLNLTTETKDIGWDFDAMRTAAVKAWAQKLNIVDVSREAPEKAATYYTDFYRVYAAKAMLDDVNGQYRDYKGEVVKLSPPADHVYSSDAAWGWQWTQGPMWSTLDPATAVSVSNGLIELADRGGWIPAAPVNLRYSPIMGAQHQNSLIIAAIQKALPGIDAGRAYAAIRHDLTMPGVQIDDKQFAGNRHYASYADRGYVADEVGPQSNTFEYAYDDWCAGQLAETLGRRADARMFQARSGNWKNAFDPQVGLARRRHADGTWVAPFDAKLFGTIGGWNGPGFMEGNAETYTYFVPQDVPGLIKAMGKDAFNARLQDMFDHDAVDMSNEPSLGMPFLFNTSGRPDLTQTYVRQVLTQDYDVSPYKGWVGEEDEGQLSAWYVLTALGLFEEQGGCEVKPAYDLTSPLFRKATIHLTSVKYGARDLVIDSEGPDGAYYVRSVTFNGRPVTGLKLPHADLIQGGNLHFVLSADKP